ncbi:MAG TPA: hypothetical protein VG206_14460 [Terriglobia bacterium]|nr:hypothetical protein [Terriglobia bacterium]
MPDTSDPHYFDFDLDRGIREQVVEKLEASPLLPLKKGVGPQASGIYALYFKDCLVYIGKASKDTTKSKREKSVGRTMEEGLAAERARRRLAVLWAMLGTSYDTSSIPCSNSAEKS